MPSKRINIDDILTLMEQGLTQVEIGKKLGCTDRTIRTKLTKLKSDDDEVVKENVKLAKQKQRYQDLNRIERKAFRDHARSENSLVELESNLLDVIKSHKLPNFKNSKNDKTKNPKSTGLIHISDTHLNELVNLIFNKYDFNVASKRLMLFADKAKRYFSTYNVKSVLVAITGDLMNSDRRMDEILAQATNRSKATFLAVSLLRNFIIDINHDFHTTVASVIGNESRVDQEIGWEDNVASHNYDYTIFNILKIIFEDTNVVFLKGNSVEQVIEVCGQNILMLHGNQLKSNNVEKDIQKIIGKYSARGIRIHFVIFGHLHSCRIGDSYARSGSLVGGNAYSDSALQLDSRASQNLHLFFKNGTRDSIKIDLQNVDKIKGYPIIKELEEYNAKSLNKAKKKTVIHRVA